MKRVFWLSLLLTLPAVPAALAEPWLCTDREGVKAFSYEPESARNPACVDHPIPSSNYWRKGGIRSQARAPSAFPRVDAKVQQQRDLARRQILERELAEEQKSLAQLQRELAEYQQVKASSIRAPSVDVRAYADRIRVHQTNIANLQKELGREG